MQFVQGTIKAIRKADGETRLLLVRQDGSDFVAVVKDDHNLSEGVIFKQGGFELEGESNGRKVYRQTRPQSVDSHIDMPTSEINASIELAAIVNLTSLLMEQPIEQVIEEIKETYGKIKQ
jgi:hypothetical protein